MDKLRKPTMEELELIEYLARKAGYQLDSLWKGMIWVAPLTEEKIGSLELIFDPAKPSGGTCSTEISNCMYYDKDGITVATYLLVDEENKLCELDMWKVDYSPISGIPPVSAMKDIPRY